MTNQSKIKDYFLNKIEIVRQKIDLLPKDGPIRTALSYDKLTDISKRISESEDKDLRIATWEPLFSFLADHSLIDIQEFETDINLVLHNSQRAQLPNVVQFLREKDDRKWAGGIFEIFIKSRLLKGSHDEVSLDFHLPNGKNTDIRLKIGEKSYCIECTVITDSNDEREAFKRWDKDGRNISIMNYFANNSIAPSIDYNCIRFYTKIYDKLSVDFDTNKNQLCDDCVNLLLLSFNREDTPLSPTSPGIDLALDELFMNQPTSRTMVRNCIDGTTDPSLISWIEFALNNLGSRQLSGSMTSKWLSDNYDYILSAPKKIGGIILFDKCNLQISRVNYNANEQNKLSHKEIVLFEELLGSPPIYER